MAGTVREEGGEKRSAWAKHAHRTILRDEFGAFAILGDDNYDATFSGVDDSVSIFIRTETDGRARYHRKCFLQWWHLSLGGDPRSKHIKPEPRGNRRR